MPCVSICEQNLVYSSNFEQYFVQKLWKTVQFLECIFKVLFNLYIVTQFHYDHIFTTKMTALKMAFQNENFSFSDFIFSRLWRTLARKLMKRPAIFITYFQITNQIVDVYQILRSEYFFQKFVGRSNLMATFFTFHHFCKKTYKKTYQFYDLFSHFQLLSAR